MDGIISQILANLLFSSPNYVIFAVGALLCVQRWRRHPTISLVLLSGLFAITVGSLIGNIGFPLGLHFVRINGGTPQTAEKTLQLVRAIAALPYAIGFALMLYAGLAERSAAGSNSDGI